VLRLVTIPISHYCEKARWALERAGLAYREERHVQGLHRIAARLAGGGRTVPVLVTLEGALGESEEILRWVEERTPRERRLFPDDPGRAMRVGWPLAVRYARRELGIRPGVEVEDEASVFGELDFVAGLLGDGRKHLCGDRFSSADLTFAALSASVLVPPVYGVSLPQPHSLSPVTAELVERVRDHPAGRYALAMFAEHRLSAVASAPSPMGAEAAG
jgi:glutathione S-transferase